MAAFCGTCGKPVAGDVKFCGGCGAPTSSSNAAQTAPPSAPSVVINAAPAATGTSALKIILVLLVVAGAGLAAVGTGAYFYGRNKVAQWKKDNGVSGDASGMSVLQAAAAAHHARTHGSGSATLTKEEVSEIILKPVTELEVQSENDTHYKTATPGYEASIEFERKDGTADATQAFQAARMVTKMAGGKAESVPGIGDDALYGAFNVLFVVKNDVFLTIMPPNLAQQAQAEMTNNMLSQPLGSDAQRAALEKMSQSMKGDPAANSLSKPDAMSGAVDLIRHSATETGNEYETKSRLMARQLAEKVLSRMGS
jgi:hypothetical protein